MKALVLIFLFWWVPVIIGMLIAWFIFMKKLSERSPLQNGVQQNGFYENATHSPSFVYNKLQDKSYRQEEKREYKNSESEKEEKERKNPKSETEVLPPDYDGNTISSLEDQLTDDEADVVDIEDFDKEEYERFEKEPIDLSDIPDEIGEKLD